MDEHLLESSASGVEIVGEVPMVDLLAELMGTWDEPGLEAIAAEMAPEIEVAAPVIEAAETAVPEEVVPAGAAAVPEAVPALVSLAPTPEEIAAEEEAFLLALLAEDEAAASGLNNLAAKVDALTETTSPSADAELPQAVADPDDAGELLDSLMSDLARAATDDHSAAPSEIDGQQPASHAEKYVLFSLAGARYAVAIHQVIETDRLPQITRVPHVPEFVRGVVNLRGDILSLVDLRTLWGLPSIEPGKVSRLLVVRSSGEQMMTGLVVDDVNGIAPIAPESLAVRDGERNEKIAPLLRGTYEHQQQSLHVIDLERLFLSPEIQQLAAN